MNDFPVPLNPDSRSCKGYAIAIPLIWNRWLRAISLEARFLSCYNNAMKVRVNTRKTICMRHQSECANDSWVEGTSSERIGYVWPLTREVVSLCGKYDAEQRLQRHITGIVRRKG
jgi:hypothetical protein